VFTGTEWVQILMNNLVMPALVVTLFKTLTDNHKKEIENHVSDKKLLQEQISKQSDIALQQSNVLKDVSNVLEKMDLRLANVEKLIEKKSS
jgi:hypothetical protein